MVIQPREWAAEERTEPHGAYPWRAQQAAPVGGAPRAGPARGGRLSPDEFLAIVVHDLRSPLGGIQNALHLLQLDSAAGTGVGRAVEMLERQVGHMGRLVDDLSDLTRLTTGKLDLRVESLDLATAVGNAAEACRPLMDQNRHRLTVTLPAEPVRFRADPTRLQQILVNLLNNATKYTDPGEYIALTALKEKQGEAGAACLVIRVRDAGIGIAPEFLPHVFDLFRQGPVRGRRGGGLGIGLALVKWLVELHGGGVAAHSDGPGKGSEFVVRLPFAADLALGKPSASPDQGATVGGTTSRSSSAR